MDADEALHEEDGANVPFDGKVGRMVELLQEIATVVNAK